MQAPESMGPRLERGVSLIEKVVQFRFGALVISFVLGADLALHWAGYPPIHELRLGADAGAVPIGAVLVFVGAFAFGMIAIAPLGSSLVQWLVMRMGLEKRDETQMEALHAYGHVLFHDARRVALQEKDPYWTKRIDDEEARQRKEQEEARTAATISFACAVLVLADGFLAGSKTIVQAAANAVERFPALDYVQLPLICLTSLLLAQPWLSWLRTAHFPRRTIYHPQLAKQRADEIAERKGGPAYRRAFNKSLTRPDHDLVS